MKRIVKFSLLIAAVLMILLAVAACARPDAESISVKAGDGFKTVYVLGQELDPSGATLEVVTSKGTEEVPLSADDVSLSGYNKNQLGEQTVAVEYRGATTSFTVKVVEGVGVTGAVTDYLVGDSLDRTMGAAKITGTDGTTLSVELSSDKLTVSGFDSSCAAQGLVLKVKYDDGTTVAEGTLTVNIYAVESVEFYSPNKVTYASHYEGAPDASGGRFVLVGNGGKLKREIPVTSDMIEGLDTSAASADNPSVSQTLTVTLSDGITKTYEVQIDYTDVSLFADSAEVFNTIVWDGDDVPDIDRTTGELAIKLMNSYIDMPESERALLDADTVFNVARAAMVAGVDIWWEAVLRFDGVFTFSGGERVLQLESYEKTKNSLSLFDDKSSPIYTTAPLLLELIELYGDSVIYEREATETDSASCIRFDSYSIMDTSDLAVMRTMLQHTVDLYDLVADVPDDWRESGLSDYYTNLGTAAYMILRENYAFEYTDIYYLVSDWREGGDLLDMLFAYLYEANGADYMSALALRGLSTNAAELYVDIFSAIVEVESLGSSASDYLDATGLIYSYYSAMDVRGLMEADAEGWESYLYNSVSVNYIFGISDSTVTVTFADMLDYVRAAVLDYTYGYLEEEQYYAVADSYVDIIKKSKFDSDYLDSAEFDTDMKALFDSFIALSPTEQSNLICVFNTYYRYGIPELSFDDNDVYAEYSSLFNRLINGFMKDRLSDAGDEAYDSLITAIEVYANRYNYPEWEEDFLARMDKASAGVALLSDTDAAFFDTYLRSAYEKYAAISESLEAARDLGEWQDEFEELYRALRDVQIATSYISDSLGNGKSYNSNYFLASYERALSLSRKILAGGSADAAYAYYHDPLFDVYGDATEMWSCDYALAMYRNVYIDLLLYVSASSGTVSIYDVYYDRGMDVFLDGYYDLVSVYIARLNGDAAEFDKTSGIAVLCTYSALESDLKALLAVLEGGVDMFGAARAAFVSEAFTAEAGKAVNMLLQIENDLYNYELTGSTISLTTAKTALSELRTIIDALVGEDAESFEPMMEIYARYQEKIDSL